MDVELPVARCPHADRTGDLLRFTWIDMAADRIPVAVVTVGTPEQAYAGEADVPELACRFHAGVHRPRRQPALTACSAALTAAAQQAGGAPPPVLSRQQRSGTEPAAADIAAAR